MLINKLYKHFAVLFALAAFAALAEAQNKPQVVASNGQTYALAGRDRQRNADEIVYYTLEYYKKNPTSNTGIDVLIVDEKVALFQDRAGAVFLEKKPDPGAIKPEGKGYILSANGAARKWILANLKIGDAVKIGEIAKNASGEVIPPASLPCFAGAYYRKAVSSFDVWTGIAGFVKLGKPQVDEKRLGEQTKQPLDNFSVYMGGNAGGKSEVDAGLSWEFTTDANGKRSERRNAFRPFWRTKTWNSAPDQKEFYFYPGETVQMAVLVAGPNKLRLIVSDGKSKTFQTDFDAEGFNSNIPRQFKRVNAIDQVANEGKPAQPTTAQVIGAEWLGTLLLRGAGADAKQIPMTAEKFTDMRCPNTNNIVVTETDKTKGAEKIDIFGTPKN
jgi:hypothetical protein